MVTPNNSRELSRREFLGTTAIAGAGLLLTSCSPENSNKTVAGAPKASGKKLNVALIGCGAEGQVLMESLQVITNINFVAVADIWDYNRKIVVGRMRDMGKPVTGYRDYEELLAGEKNLDAVVVATPDFWHAPITNACLKHGLHVYCEKMMSHTIEGARSMVQTMRETGKLLQIGHQRRSNPRYRFALNKFLHEAQVCGKLTNAYGQWNRAVTQDLGFPKKSDIAPETLAKYGFKDMHQFRNWRWFKGLGKGPLSDLGAHQIDIFNWFFDGIPHSVMASGGIDYYTKHEWFDNAMVVYEFARPDGTNMRAFYQVQTTTSGGGGYFETFMGDEGTLRMSENPGLCALWREDRSTKDWDGLAGDGLIRKVDVPPVPEEEKVDARESIPLVKYGIPVQFAKLIHQPHLENFFNAVLDKNIKLTCPADEAFRSEYVIHKAVEAVETGQKIKITKEETEA